MLDYARGFGLPAAVFRMSCIYGPHQCGTEDQGWVAHFALRALAGDTVSIYGDGNQVRDLLYVDDLVDAMLLVQRNITQLSGHAFNIGGGVDNTASVMNVIDIIRELHGSCEVAFDAWRPSDQRYYVSDTRKFQDATGWRARVNVPEGIARMYEWLRTAQRQRALPRAERPTRELETITTENP